ncbi:rot1 [Candida metapsilosis]|uniref:Protein ROT1 n=1 Tax=Candida metapsilosis TaxID=273372 RepID=A0A8H7ZBM6_9ASCO|nr:rot1 [Candida metapsilosis]
MIRLTITLLTLLSITSSSKFHPPNIHGTWQTQSQSVITGPKFFQPDKEYLIEPTQPGLSYSFDLESMTYETAQYLVTANPQNHSCPSAELIWHHGKIKIKPHRDQKGKGKKNNKKKNKKSKADNDGQFTILLESIPHDSRQLLSDPCVDEGTSTYQRYKCDYKQTWSGVYQYDKYVDNWSLILYDEFGESGRKVWMWLKSRDVEMLPRGRITKKKKVYVDV